ncbi:MAG TPA: phosphotransferase [Chloroflexota bacterium]|nr:phosphotransferase [Chloroflexota bacterium]
MAARNPPTVAWTIDDVRAFLGLYGRAPERLAVEQLESWWCNTVLRLEADGERLVLRRYGLTPPEEVRWELALLGHLRTHQFPTIAPLAHVQTRDGTDETDAYLAEFLGSPAILYPYVEGHNACDGRVERGRGIAQTATVVARLHGLTEGLALPHPRVRSGTDSLRLLRELREYAAHRVVPPPDTALREMLRQGDATMQQLTARIEPYIARPHDLPRGIVHHDAHCANVLFRDDRLVALIDFDDACEGFLLADLSAMVANWAVTSQGQTALNHDWAAVVVREYERHRPLTAAERDLLPDFVAAFLLADAAAYVRDRLEQDADGDTAVHECHVYRRFLHHAGDGERLRELRRMLSRRDP